MRNQLIRTNTFTSSPSPDGQRFLVNIRVDYPSPPTLNLITNWENAALSRK
jgi:hypothetical protein